LNGAANPRAPELNAAQRRALAVALRLLEERLAIIDGILEHEEAGVLYRRPRLPASPESRRLIEAELADVRSAIASISGTFGLEADPRDPVREISGLLSISWENLGDVGSRGLAAYGPVDHRLHAVLDPDLEALMARLVRLERIFRMPASKQPNHGGFDSTG
jgi:hypothetical protein